ncbi:hypothetical protein SAMN05444722_3690 [Rhodovulum sp. ES.010]|nr:hypothetical protein SAMN05444722_3690 [Rhodovulum sp. ES.010]
MPNRRPVNSRKTPARPGRAGRPFRNLFPMGRLPPRVRVRLPTRRRPGWRRRWPGRGVNRRRPSQAPSRGAAASSLSPPRSLWGLRWVWARCSFRRSSRASALPRRRIWPACRSREAVRPGRCPRPAMRRRPPGVRQQAVPCRPLHPSIRSVTCGPPPAQRRVWERSRSPGLALRRQTRHRPAPRTPRSRGPHRRGRAPASAPSPLSMRPRCRRCRARLRRRPPTRISGA